MVPRLTTALAGPLPDLERAHPRPHARDRALAAHASGRSTRRRSTASVDLRNAGFKLAPVDTNLFPGGFNNLNPDFHAAVRAGGDDGGREVCPDARGVLLVPENHTRNQFYLQNVATLADDPAAGRDARAHRHLLRRDHARRPSRAPRRRQLAAASRSSAAATASASTDFDPCMVLLNNDLSAGTPDILDGHRAADRCRRCTPAGTVRRKSHHFEAYRDVARSSRSCSTSTRGSSIPYFEDCGEDRFPGPQGRGVPRRRTSRSCSSDIRAKYARIRHRRGAVRDRQGRRRHLRHGHHDGAGPVRSAGPEPQAAQQDGGREGRARGPRRSSSRKASTRSRSSTTRSPSPSST